MSEEAEVVPVKRKRGRPRKVRPEEVATVAPTPEAVPVATEKSEPEVPWSEEPPKDDPDKAPWEK